MGGYGKFDEAIKMMAEGRFQGEPLITGRIGLENLVSEGFEALVKDKEKHIKILVSPI